MGLFDRIAVYAECPFTGRTGTRESQTKQLGRHMYHYVALMEEQYPPETGNIKGNFEQLLLDSNVARRFPKDKSNEVWASQREFVYAQATVPKEYQDLDELQLSIRCDCPECIIAGEEIGQAGRWYKAKIKVQDGMIIGPIYDIQIPKMWRKDFVENQL